MLPFHCITLINQEKMKNFICFLFCSFLMLFASVNAQASSFSEPIPCKSDVSAVDVGLPVIQNSVVSIAPMECMTMVIFQSAAVPIFSNIQMLESELVIVPKCPFRYLYKSKYSTHYSHTAFSRLIAPY